MNKLTAVSLVAVLGVVGGGAYMMKDSETGFDMNNLNLSQYAEYIPEPITSLFGIESSETSPEDTATTAVNEMIDSLDDTNTEMVETAEVETQTDDQLFMQDAKVEPEATEEMVEVEAETTKVVVEDVVSNNNPATGNIEAQIESNNSEITRLETENKSLEERFQNILKKNRSLANELKELDAKLANVN